MIRLPQMLLIGSFAKGAGKTTLACELIKRFKFQYKIIAIKITIIDEQSRLFHGAQLTGLSESEKKYLITEEQDSASNNDTSRLLSAGAQQAFWLQTTAQNIMNGFEKLMADISLNSIIICESSSLRNHVEPGLFIITQNQNSMEVKASAKKVGKFADKIVSFDGANFDFDIDDIGIVEGKWTLLANHLKDQKSPR